MRAGQAVLALGVHRLAQSHQREAERPVVRTVSSAEIAVVQFDLDQPLPPLTTIRLSRTDLARAAFEALRQQAEEPNNKNLQREFLVSTSLVVRESTCAPAAGR